MDVTAHSCLMTGVSVIAASAIAIAPSVEAPPPTRTVAAPTIQLAANSQQLAQPLIFGPGTIVNRVVDVVTEAAVGVVNLYYLIRDVAGAGVNLLNAIVFNPYIQIWPLTAIATQVT